MNSRSDIVGLIVGLSLVGTACDDGTYAKQAQAHALEERAFSWEDPVQLGVFQPNGVKQMVSQRGDVPANAWHAVRVNLPDSPETTPPSPAGLTWRVEDVLSEAPVAVLSTELDLRHDAYVGHAANWGADVVATRARIVAESTEGSEVATAQERRAQTLKAALKAVSPRTGEEFEIPEIATDRRLRFIWAQKPDLADFALDPVRPLERGVVIVGESPGCGEARNWAEGRGVRVVSLDDPEAAELRAFFGKMVGTDDGADEERVAPPVRLPALWTGDAVVTGFDTDMWNDLFHVKQ